MTPGPYGARAFDRGFARPAERVCMDDKPRPPLEDLDFRLRKARGEDRRDDRGRLPGTRLGQALHLAIEMAAALAVGGGLGWLLDDWMETGPWLFVVFIFVGIAAGILNAFRAAQRLGATPLVREGAGRRDESEDERRQR